MKKKRDYSQLKLNLIVLCFTIVIWTSYLTSASDTILVNKWATTFTEFRKKSYSWVIRNFSLYGHQNDEFLESPSIGINEPNNMQWAIRMYPRGTSNEKYIALHLLYKSGKSPKIEAAYKFMLLNKYFKIIKTEENNFVTFEQGDNKFAGYNNFIKRSEVLDPKKNILLDDIFNIIVEFHVKVDSVKSIAGNFTDNYYMETSDLLKPYFNHFKFADIIFRVRYFRIPAHAIVIASQSTLLNMTEKYFPIDRPRGKWSDNANCLLSVPIDHALLYDYHTFYDVLLFLYTGEVKDLDLKKAKHFLKIAYEFEIHKLKYICEVFLCKTITLCNAIDFLFFADCFDAELLKEKAVFYIAAHIYHFIGTEKYEELKRFRSDLVVDIMDAIFKLKCVQTL